MSTFENGHSEIITPNFAGGGAFLVLLEFSPFCLKKSRCDYKKKIKEILPEKLFVLPEFF